MSSDTPNSIPKNFRPDIGSVQLLRKSWGILRRNPVEILTFNLVYLISGFILSATIIGILVIPGISAGYLLNLSGYIRNKEKLNPVNIFKLGWPYWSGMAVYYLILLVSLIIIAFIWYIALLFLCYELVFFVYPILLMIYINTISMYFVIPSFMIIDKRTKPLRAFIEGFKLIFSSRFFTILVFSFILVLACIINWIIYLSSIYLGLIFELLLYTFIVSLLMISAFLAYEEIYDRRKPD